MEIETAVPPDETRQLLKSIRRIVRANDLQSRALAKAIGLTGPQLAVLKAAAELGEVTTTALADHADLSPATVVTVLDNLEQRAIITRHRSATDRRVVYTKLTPRGWELVTHSPGPFGSGFAEKFASLPPERRRALLAALGEVAEMMARQPAT